MTQKFLDDSMAQSSQPSTPEIQADDVEKRNPDQKGVTAGYERQYVTGIAKWLILGPVTLAYFTYFLDLAVLSTATPAITSEFSSLVDIGWYGFPPHRRHFRLDSLPC
jgi:hypothetical protein